MNRKDVQMLLIVLGILIAVLTWQFVYNANQEKIANVEAENASLEKTVRSLEALEEKEPEFKEETKRMKQECKEIVAKFPADFRADDRIMYLYNMECAEENNVVVPGITLGTPNEVSYSGSTTQGEYTLQDEGIKMYDIQSNISFSTTYQGFKNVIAYIYRMPGRKSVSSVSLSASGDGYLVGSMSMDFYYMTGTDTEYRPMQIPAVRIGKDNIFGVLNETGNVDAEDAE